MYNKFKFVSINKCELKATLEVYNIWYNSKLNYTAQ